MYLYITLKIMYATSAAYVTTTITIVTTITAKQDFRPSGRRSALSRMHREKS